MIETLQSFCRAFGFPPEAEACFTDAAQHIADNREAMALLEENTRLLWADAFKQTGSDMVRLDRIAALTGIHPYTIYLLFFMLCAPRTRQAYIDKGIDLAIFHDSMMDLKSKLIKTYDIYGVWGAKWGFWFRQFFLLQRFALGRLQFELVPSLAEHTFGNIHIRVGDPVLNLHIPALGPLDRAAVLDSYRRAAAFYSYAFPEGTIPFQCLSWLLYPPVADLFPEGNLKTFQRDFIILTEEVLPPKEEDWRVFRVPETVPVEAYPENTTLQKNLKAWLLAGNQMGQSIGMFYYKDGQILSSENQII